MDAALSGRKDERLLLSGNQHISIFAVWQEQVRKPDDIRETPEPPVEEAPSVLDLEGVRQQAAQALGFAFDAKRSSPTTRASTT